MNTDLTQDQIDSYRQNGFVVLHDFLTPEELETWRQAVDGAVRQRGKQKMFNQEVDEDQEETYYDYVFVQRINLWQDSLDVRRLILDPRLGRMASDLAGVEGVRIWHDQALIKQPWANPTGWHLDNPYWSYSSRKTLSLWVALDDATLENGCLYFLPGSHKTATYDNAGIGENIGDIFRVYPQWKDIMASPAEMKAGSASFHNGLIAHGAGANMTPGWRRAMTCGFMPDGCTFNGIQNILNDEQFASYEIGDLLDDDRQNPLIFHRSKPYEEKLDERFAQ
ncbi:MAG: phytanoyl-CoA dioxygenase family protein [Caldilineaceae bacterium SB0675_bin_29]|uniref:Phytanoyl-CoA dioxygenase family protein n=1 Tax=Caldilineaceae bacterium SB0675_bin_29 TaxID=2605266 RepID=A0A6B1FYE2_9CHLR|nr:phytanoyl-CoA dioxygenase family protein [Caldilineaceae bacterium SB0675_bin_29]